MSYWSRARGLLPALPVSGRNLSLRLCWLLALWLLAGALPRRPWVNGAGVDASWYLALNLIHEQGLVFGRHIAYTMGPLGYLFTPEPELVSAGQVLLLRVLNWLLLLWAAFAALRRLGPPQGAAVAAVLATQALLDRTPADVWQAGYMAALLALAWADAWAPVRLTVAAIAAGLSMLLKANEGLAAFLLYYLLCVPALWRHRPGRLQAAFFLALPPATVLLWFGLVERDLFAVFPYFRNFLETTSGYSDAMSIDGPLWQVGLTVLYGMLILSVPVVSGEWRWLRSPAFLCFGLSAFVGFKHAMVRQDGHADLALQKLALAGLFLLAACTAPLARRLLVPVLLFGSAFTWIYVLQEQPWLVRIAASRLTPQGIMGALRTLADWSREYQGLQIHSHNARTHLRLPAEFHEAIRARSVDAFPHCIDVICANGWNYRPRPTIESSGAYTPALDRLNADHFSGDRAPDFVLFVWEAIDGRHPLLQDAATLHALKTRYRPVLVGDRALLMERRSPPVQVELIPAGETSVAWNQPVELPDSGPGEFIYFAADIQPSPYGALRTFLLRAAPIHLRVWRRSGKEGWYRSVRRLLTIPAQIRPLPENLAEFSEMLESPAREEEDPVQAIAWTTPRPAEYDPEIRVKWFRVRWVADSEGGASGLAESTRGEQRQR
ncbi:MAG: membrane protein [Bryobacteraceae bacterium]|nr:MAG: membrane protein [Bryobacteraceae bacterium]